MPKNAFGLGVLSALYSAPTLGVHTRDRSFTVATAAVIRGEDIPVHAALARKSTSIRPDGVHPPQPALTLADWAERELTRLCEAFTVPVAFLRRRCATTSAPPPPTLQWRPTAMGRVLLDLSTQHTQRRCFLQGLPVGRTPSYGKQQVVLLPDATLAKPPDRRHLLNETDDHKRIQAANDQAHREGLIEVKAGLAASDFVTHYAHSRLDSSNIDLLNDVPFAPKSWLHDWTHEPAGFCRSWEGYSAERPAFPRSTAGAWREGDRDL